MGNNLFISPYAFPGIKDVHNLLKNRKFKKETVTIEQILEVVSKHSGVTISEIVSTCRKRTIVDARFIFLTMVKRKSRRSLKEIGQIINRDHTSVIHAIRTHEDRYEMYEDYRNMTNSVVSELNQISE